MDAAAVDRYMPAWEPSKRDENMKALFFQAAEKTLVRRAAERAALPALPELTPCILRPRPKPPNGGTEIWLPRHVAEQLIERMGLAWLDSDALEWLNKRRLALLLFDSDGHLVSSGEAVVEYLYITQTHKLRYRWPQALLEAHDAEHVLNDCTFELYSYPCVRMGVAVFLPERLYVDVDADADVA